MGTLLRVWSVKRGLARALAELLGAETPNSIQTKAKNQSILFAQTDVETRKLRRHRTTVPAMSERHGGTDE